MSKSDVYIISSGDFGQNSDILSQLLAKAKSGQSEAFAEIYQQYFKKIYRFIFYRVSHKEVAEDLAEEVFVKAFAKISSVSEDSSFEGWLYQIARNLVIDYYRQKKLTIPLDEVENTLFYESNVIDVLNLKQQQKILLDVLRELTSEQQVLIKLKFLEGLSNSEISELLGKSEGALRVIQHRAIIKLQELIKNREQSNEQ